jgi:hypothetical protein
MVGRAWFWPGAGMYALLMPVMPVAYVSVVAGRYLQIHSRVSCCVWLCSCVLQAAGTHVLLSSTLTQALMCCRVQP